METDGWRHRICVCPLRVCLRACMCVCVSEGGEKRTIRKTAPHNTLIRLTTYDITTAIQSFICPQKSSLMGWSLTLDHEPVTTLLLYLLSFTAQSHENKETTDVLTSPT